MKESPIIFRTTVAEQWIDYNNHMTEYAYSLVFGQAIDAFAQRYGIGRDYCLRTGFTLYTLISQINFVHEAKLGSIVDVDLLMLDTADSAMHVFQGMYDQQRQLKATYEAVIAHVNQRPHPRVAPFPSSVRHGIEELQRQHAVLGRPARAGLAVGIRR